MANPSEGSSGASLKSPLGAVDRNELNAWRRGFPPQAEIWNGRLAMLGLSVGMLLLVAWRLLTAA